MSSARHDVSDILLFLAKLLAKSADEAGVQNLKGCYATNSVDPHITPLIDSSLVNSNWKNVNVISECSPKKCKSAGERDLFSPSHTISGCKHVMQKQIIFFFTPLLRIWSKCFRSRTKNVHTSVGLWSQGMPQRVFDTSFSYLRT